MSRSTHPNITADQRAERRARRAPRPTTRRTGTLSGILAAEARDTWPPLVRTTSGSIELNGREV